MRRLLFGVFAALVVLVLVGPVTPKVVAAGENLWAPQECSYNSAGKIFVSFAWTGGSSLALAQWFDIGTSNRWNANSYAEYGPLPPGDLMSQPVDSLAPKTRYYARVIELMPWGDWTAGPTYVVDTSTCSASGEIARPGPFDAFMTGKPERAHSTSSSVLVTEGDAGSAPSSGNSNGGTSSTGAKMPTVTTTSASPQCGSSTSGSSGAATCLPSAALLH